MILSNSNDLTFTEQWLKIKQKFSEINNEQC